MKSRSGFETAKRQSAKPCQGDSSEILLDHKQNPDDLHSFRNSDACYHDPETCEHVGLKATTSHGSNTSQQRMLKRFTVADDLKECSKITQFKGTKPKSTTLWVTSLKGRLLGWVFYPLVSPNHSPLGHLKSLYLSLFPAMEREALTRLNSSIWVIKWFKRLVAYAKCNRDSYESELGIKSLREDGDNLKDRDSGEEDDDEKAKDKTCLMAHTSNEICLGIDLEPDEWIKNSGCSIHMTGNRKIFSSYKAYNGEHVDNLRFNLLSVGQICDNKCKVIFSKHDSKITKDGKVIGRGIRKSGLYVMKLGKKPKDKICLTTIIENSSLWHRRLGHPNMHLIQSLASKELVRNLPKLKFDQNFCDACKIGKQAHASHKSNNIVSTTRCLEHLHMDLFGPSAIQSY
ncbi:retrovirus-related pol polyprotein from transposon TNT 1-94 [Tanacetum coccineum]|uniref:Retrovirus-related pol polyprotein from transposon TNT 1-94 n=1 Tax=Tanacetum coccineum TaxID=301880 RepID=A0ABQ5BBK1_9ASTR